MAAYLLVLVTVLCSGTVLVEGSLEAVQCPRDYCRNNGICYYTSDFVGAKATLECSPGWQLASGQCYRILWQMTTQPNAEKNCKDDGKKTSLFKYNKSIKPQLIISSLMNAMQMTPSQRPHVWTSECDVMNNQTHCMKLKYPYNSTEFTPVEFLAFPFCTRPLTPQSDNKKQCSCPKKWRGERCEEEAYGMNIGEHSICKNISCSSQQSLVVEFASYGRLSSDVASCEQKTVENPALCYSPNSLGVVKYWCQGKSSCDVFSKLKTRTVLGDPCGTELKSTTPLVIRTSCRNNTHYCPSNEPDNMSILYKGTCLQFVKRFGNWWDALEYCSRKAGSLAFLPSSNIVIHELESFRLKIMTSISFSIWIGGQSNKSFSDNDNTRTDSGTQLCSYLEVNPETRVATPRKVTMEERLKCELAGSAFPWICNFPVRNGTCGNATLVNLGQDLCLKVILQHKSWGEAKAHCQNSNGSLLLYLNEPKYQTTFLDFVINEMRNRDLKFWIGGQANESRPLNVTLDPCSTGIMHGLSVRSTAKQSCALNTTKNIALCAFPPTDQIIETPTTEHPSSTRLFSSASSTSQFAETSLRQLLPTSPTRHLSQNSSTVEISSPRQFTGTSPALTVNPSTAQFQDSKFCKGKKFTTHRGETSWPETKPNKWHMNPCPSNHSGHIKWFCNGSSGEFSPPSGPDWSNCSALNKPQMTDSSLDSEAGVSILLDNMNQQQQLYGSDLDYVLNEVDGLLDQQKKELMVPSEISGKEEEVALNFTNQVAEVLDKLLKEENNNAWLDYSMDKRVQVSGKLLRSVDSAGFVLAETMVNKSTIIQKEGVDVHVSSFPRSVYKDKPISSDSNQFDGSFITIPSKHAFYPDGPILTVFTKYRNLSIILPTKKFYQGTHLNSSYELNSVVLGATVVHENATFKYQSDFVIIHARHLRPSIRKPICVFWNLTGFWDSGGCSIYKTNATYTICYCNHLTNFAVLMDVHGVLEEGSIHAVALTWITIAGCTISIACLATTSIIFIAFRSLWSVRSTIHCNLCASLAVAQFILLIGLDRTEYKVVCSIVAGLLHFAWLSAFAWVALEGLHIYVLLVKVFDTGEQKIWLYYLTGYGIPTLIVTISAICKPSGYGTDRHCWLSTNDGFIFSFAIPMLVVVLFNFVIFILAMKAASTVKVQRLESKVHTTRLWIRRSASLIPLLGLTWIFGFLYADKNSVAFAYFFALFNSAQGVFIFLFHCVRNEKVQQVVGRYLAKRRERSDSSFFKKSRSNSCTATSSVRTSTDDFNVTRDISWSLNQSIKKGIRSTPRGVLPSRWKRTLHISTNQISPSSNNSHPVVLVSGISLHTDIFV